MELSNPGISRRSFFKIGAAGLTAATVLAREAEAARVGKGKKEAGRKSKKIPIGLQLYSVREQCAKDLPGVLAAVAKMGYAGVEYAGYYGRDAKELRKLMDDNGLVCCGTHTALSTLLGDNLKGTVEFNKILGNKYLIVPSMPKERAASKETWLETAKLFNELAEKVKADGMLVGYHAHGGDFKKIGDETPWDIFFGATNKEVVMQLDIGNCLEGGGDPYAVLRKFPGRSTTIHLKEAGGPKTAVIGEGDVKWDEVFALCEKGGTEWYIVEHERGGPDPLGDVRRCLENLRKMGK